MRPDPKKIAARIRKTCRAGLVYVTILACHCAQPLLPSPAMPTPAACITRAERAIQNRHRGAVLWLTGLSGAGKSTVAQALARRLFALDCRSYVLDGDQLRGGLCADLGFSDAARSENIRRAGELAALFADAGMIVICAFISPFAHDRARARALLPAGDFLEIYCQCPLAVCEERDVKGLYRRARAGQLPQFTGISSPYEIPGAPELVLDTGGGSVDAAVAALLVLLRERRVTHQA
jgi:adenylylsulfate kinase